MPSHICSTTEAVTPAGRFLFDTDPDLPSEAAAGLTLNIGDTPLLLSDATGTTFTVDFEWPNSGVNLTAGTDVTVSLTGEEPDPEAAPTVSTVVVTSDPGADETYGTGDVIRVTVTFGAAVTVDTGGGRPRIQLRIGGGDPEHRKWADYEGGSGSEALVFAYTVRAWRHGRQRDLH